MGKESLRDTNVTNRRQGAISNHNYNSCIVMRWDDLGQGWRTSTTTRCIDIALSNRDNDNN